MHMRRVVSRSRVLRSCRIWLKGALQMWRRGKSYLGMQGEGQTAARPRASPSPYCRRSGCGGGTISVSHLLVGCGLSAPGCHEGERLEKALVWSSVPIPGNQCAGRGLRHAESQLGGRQEAGIW
jgi:hypothetical protein